MGGFLDTSSSISKPFAQISRPSMMLDSVDLLEHQVVVEMPKKKNVEQVLCIQPPGQFSGCYGLDLLALRQISRVFPWCCAFGVHLKSMRNRVTQNPWPPSLHFELAVFRLDVLAVPWPQPMLVKITKGAGIRPTPWPYFGFYQGLKAKATHVMKLYFNKLISQRNSHVEVFDKNNHELLLVVQPLPLQSSLCLSSLVLEPLSQQIRFMCNSVIYKDANGCDELTCAGLKLPEPETLMLKSVIKLTMKHHNSSIHASQSQEVSFGVHWLWRNSEKQLFIMECSEAILDCMCFF